MHNIISQATGGSLASGYTGVTETTSINHGKMTAQVYTSPIWTPPPQPVQFQPLYMPLDPYLGQPFPKIQQYSPPPQFYSHSTQIHSPPQVQQPPQIHSPPLYQPTYFPPIIPTESSHHLSFYPASPMNSPLTRQPRKTQFISTASSGKQLAATRLEPMATKTQQTYATYYSHRIFVGSLARMVINLFPYFSTVSFEFILDVWVNHDVSVVTWSP